MSKNLVVKDNALINASYNLDLVEQRLILLAIVEARASGKGISPNRSLTISASSYMNHFNTNRNTAYQALKDACNSLFERQFSFVEQTDKGEKVVRTRWVSRVAYVENSATVELIFAPDVAPLITMLEKNFTSYELEQVAELNSKYAVRLYEVIIAWRSTGKTPMITVDELRDRLGVLDDEYQITGDFKKRVLDYSLKQLNEKTDISVSYEQHKEGRKIIGFTFTSKQKAQKTAKIAKPKNTEKDTKTVDMFDNLTEIERQTIQERIDEYIQELENQEKIVSDFQRKNITKKAFKERWGLDVLAKKQEKAAKDKAERERKAAAKKAEQDKKDREKLENERRKNEMIAKFENLTAEQQKYVLNQVYKMLKNTPFGELFKNARNQGDVHKNPRFLNQFLEYFEL